MVLSKSEPRVPSAPALPVPKRIGRFEVLGRLATGGMADVFICSERGLGGLERFVVVKRILPNLVVHPAFVEMFLAEARYVARLNHPNVVQIIELGEEADHTLGATPYLAMEYVAGSSLRDVLVASIERFVLPPVGAAIGLIAQACAGAHAAHELTDPEGKPLGLVHRDISPHNLMVTGEGHVKLLDFGIAKATEAQDLEDSTRTGALKGKVHYMAPEQCKQEPLDRRADVFALGIVLWELLAQERLFKRDSDLDSMQAIVSGDLRKLAGLRPDIPRPIVDAVEKALRRERQDRYATADEMRRGLVDACAQAHIRCDLDAVAAFVGPLIGEQQAQRRTQLLTLASERTEATPAERAGDATLVDKRLGRHGAGAERGVGSQSAAIADDARGATGDGGSTSPSRASGTASRSASGTASRSTSASESAGPALAPSSSLTSSRASSPPGRGTRGLQRSHVVAAAVALAGALGLLVVQSFAPPTGPPLRIGFPGTAQPELVLEDLRPLDAHLERRLGRPVEVVVSSSYEQLLAWFQDGSIAVAVLPPNTYVQARERLPDIRLLAQKIIDGASGSDGVLVVHEESAATTVAELRGKRVCFADPLSTTGYVLARKALRAAGLDPDADVLPHLSGNHIQVLRDVVDKVCEAGATYSGGYLAADRAGVPVARLRQLAITGRSPQDALCIRGTATDDEVSQIRAALLAYDPTALGPLGARVERITGFELVSDHDYDAVRELAAPAH